jgi:transposase-like protein
MQERGVEVDHSTLNRWVVKYVPRLDKQFRERKRPVGSSWRMDETYVRIKGVPSRASAIAPFCPRCCFMHCAARSCAS